MQTDNMDLNAMFKRYHDADTACLSTAAVSTTAFSVQYSRRPQAVEKGKDGEELSLEDIVVLILDPDLAKKQMVGSKWPKLAFRYRAPNKRGTFTFRRSCALTDRLLYHTSESGDAARNCVYYTHGLDSSATDQSLLSPPPHITLAFGDGLRGHFTKYVFDSESGRIRRLQNNESDLPDFSINRLKQDIVADDAPDTSIRNLGIKHGIDILSEFNALSDDVNDHMKGVVPASSTDTETTSAQSGGGGAHTRLLSLVETFVDKAGEKSDDTDDSADDHDANLELWRLVAHVRTTDGDFNVAVSHDTADRALYCTRAECVRGDAWTVEEPDSDPDDADAFFENFVDDFKDIYRPVVPAYKRMRTSISAPPPSRGGNRSSWTFIALGTAVVAAAIAMNRS
nr:hypothetical protein TetV2_00615 [Oceanusvirus sp.]